MKTINISADLQIPVTVAQEALATKAMEILRSELLKSSKRVIDEFVANGITSALADVAIKMEQKTTKVG